MKDRWGIDFKSGTFVQKAIDAGLDYNYFFEDPIRVDTSED